MVDLMFGALGAGVWLLLILLAVPWIVLPFAIFQMRKSMLALVEETRRTNALLSQQSRPPVEP